MKKSAVSIDVFEKTIVISKAYYKKACVYGSSEYYEFRAVMSENEGYTVEFKSSEKKTYKELTFARMEKYIETQPNSKKMLITFQAVQKIAEQKGCKYPLTKKWFLENYPSYKENNVSADERSALEKELTEKSTKCEDKSSSNVVALPTESDTENVG